jgi:hypothetical protein
LAAQPALLAGDRAPMLPPVPALTVSGQQRWKVTPSALSAAGIVKLLVAVVSNEAPVHLTKRYPADGVAVALMAVLAK